MGNYIVVVSPTLNWIDRDYQTKFCFLFTKTSSASICCCWPNILIWWWYFVFKSNKETIMIAWDTQTVTNISSQIFKYFNLMKTNNTKFWSMVSHSYQLETWKCGVWKLMIVAVCMKHPPSESCMWCVIVSPSTHWVVFSSLHALIANTCPHLSCCLHLFVHDKTVIFHA